MFKTFKKKIIIVASLLLIIILQSSSRAPFKEWQGTALPEAYKERIYDLAVVYGYIRYFYPNEKFDKTDWFKYIVYALKEIETCQSTTDFHAKLEKLFAPLCPHLSVNDSVTRKISHSSGDFYINEHRFENMQLVGKIKKISEYTTDYPKPDSMYTFHISTGLYVSFPIALSELPETDLPNKQIKTGDAINYKWTEYHARIANEIIRCNIVQHFYPYYIEDGLDVKWKQAYKDYFGYIAECQNISDYYQTVCKMMNIVKDTHVFDYLGITSGIISYCQATSYPEIETVIYDSLLFVKSIGSANSQTVKSGDRIVKINDRNATEVIKDKLQYTSYSTLKSGRVKLMNELFEVLQHKSDSVIRLTVCNSNGEEATVNLPASLSNPFYGIKQQTFVEKLDGDIYYVNLTESDIIKYKNFKTYIPFINSGKGVIFDMRGYPNISVISILSHLTDTVLALGNLQESVVYFPDHLQTRMYPVEKWFIAPAMSDLSKSYAKKYQYPMPVRQKINKPCVFLVNANSISFMETLVDMIKHYRLGILVGENTAGCNGDVAQFNLPFGNFTITGYKFMNRDGTQHHGIGIEPDIYVENTDPFTDKQLETAIKYLNGLETNH